MRKVLIIGSGGFLGASIADFLAKQGCQITALCHHAVAADTAWSAAMHNIIIGDITTNETLKQIAEQSWDSVIYLISLNHFDSEGDIEQVNKMNVLSLWKVADILKDKTKKFIYFSTQQVYGTQKSSLIDENCTPAPRNTYGLTHLMCEDITTYFNQKSSTDFINVRLSNGYGAPALSTSNCWWLVINDLCKMAYEQHCIRLQSDGSPQRDFIHTEDIARAILLLTTESTQENIYNISSGITYTIGEIALLVKNVIYERTAKNIPIYLPNGETLIHLPATQTRTTVSNSRLKSVGFKSQIDIETGINSILDYLSANNE